MVYLRGSRFHYRFLRDGKSYYGPCPGCDIPAGARARDISEIKKRAAAYEKSVRETVEDVRSNRTIVALVENYKRELTGCKPISLSEVPGKVRRKPWKKKASDSYWDQKDLYWRDFTAFMTATFPEVKTLDAVRRNHCEAYVAYITENGRYVREVVQPGKKVYRLRFALSGKTVAEIAGVCKSYTERLLEDAGMAVNPWNNIILPDKGETSREIFTPEELAKIADGISLDETKMEAAYEGSSLDFPQWREFAIFCRPLFLIASDTGLSESDICSLKWSEIDAADQFIRRKRNKTGNRIEAPILPALQRYLASLPERGEYVLPEHAAMYSDNKSGVSYRVKEFLHGLGIRTVVEREGRRAVSVKDLHSLRHVFCYRAIRAGIPSHTVARIVGHKTVAMTEHYASHDTADDLKRAIEKLPSVFASGETEGSLDACIRRKLAELVQALPGRSLERALASMQRILAEDSREDGGRHEADDRPDDPGQPFDPPEIVLKDGNPGNKPRLAVPV